MGVVYRAWQRSTSRDVAIKTVRPLHGPAADALAARFTREGRVTAGLKSPHTVTIHEFGRLDDGALFLVMELLDGVPLDVLLEGRGPLPLGVVAEIGAQVCRSLAEAHARGVVHRDLKPSNIIVEVLPGGHLHAKVLDFGVAKLLDDPNLALTATGAAIGTVAYMSPEQADGTAEVGPASDLYALGVTLFELATGERPFRADSRLALMFKHASEAPPPLSRLLATSPEVAQLEAVLERCLKKPPSARFPDADALREALLEPPLGDRPRALAATDRGRRGEHGPGRAGRVLAVDVALGSEGPLGVATQPSGVVARAQQPHGAAAPSSPGGSRSVAAAAGGRTVAVGGLTSAREGASSPPAKGSPRRRRLLGAGAAAVGVIGVVALALVAVGGRGEPTASGAPDAALEASSSSAAEVAGTPVAARGRLAVADVDLAAREAANASLATTDAAAGDAKDTHQAAGVVEPLAAPLAPEDVTSPRAEPDAEPEEPAPTPRTVAPTPSRPATRPPAPPAPVAPAPRAPVPADEPAPTPAPEPLAARASGVRVHSDAASEAVEPWARDVVRALTRCYAESQHADAAPLRAQVVLARSGRVQPTSASPSGAAGRAFSVCADRRVGALALPPLPRGALVRLEATITW